MYGFSEFFLRNEGHEFDQLVHTRLSSALLAKNETASNSISKQGLPVTVQVAQNVPTSLRKMQKYIFFQIVVSFPHGVIKDLNEKKAYLTVIEKRHSENSF